MAPSGELAVGFDLAIEEAGDASRDRFGAFCVEGSVGEVVGQAAMHEVIEERERADHCSVVDGDAARVAGPEGIELRPAAAGILGFEEVADAFQKALLVAVVTGGGVDFGEEAQFGVRGVVVEGAGMFTLS